jgi:hypothetical protein
MEGRRCRRGPGEGSETSSVDRNGAHARARAPGLRGLLQTFASSRSLSVRPCSRGEPSPTLSWSLSSFLAMQKAADEGQEESRLTRLELLPALPPSAFGRFRRVARRRGRPGPERLHPAITTFALLALSPLFCSHHGRPVSSSIFFDRSGAVSTACTRSGQEGSAQALPTGASCISGRGRRRQAAAGRRLPHFRAWLVRWRSALTPSL